jgi:hypothetical protein
MKFCVMCLMRIQKIQLKRCKSTSEHTCWRTTVLVSERPNFNSEVCHILVQWPWTGFSITMIQFPHLQKDEWWQPAPSSKFREDSASSTAQDPAERWHCHDPWAIPLAPPPRGGRTRPLRSNSLARISSSLQRDKRRKAQILTLPL